MARKNYHHGALRQALIDGAREILTERGHQQFSLNEVARRVGVSASAPYRHFSNRDDLLTAVATEGYAIFHESLTRADLGPPDPRARLIALGGAYVRFAHEYPDLFATMFRTHQGEGPLGLDSFDILLRAVLRAQHEGVLRPSCSPELMARSIWAALHGISVLMLARPHTRFGMDAAPEELAEDTLSALLGL